MARKMDHVIDSLERHLARDSDATLALRLHLPIRWDPFLTEVRTLADLYHHATWHFDFHCDQLTLAAQDWWRARD
jgi:hypothetical protein